MAVMHLRLEDPNNMDGALGALAASQCDEKECTGSVGRMYREGLREGDVSDTVDETDEEGSQANEFRRVPSMNLETNPTEWQGCGDARRTERTYGGGINPFDSSSSEEDVNVNPDAGSWAGQENGDEGVSCTPGISDGGGANRRTSNPFDSSLTDAQNESVTNNECELRLSGIGVVCDKILRETDERIHEKTKNATSPSQSSAICSMFPEAVPASTRFSGSFAVGHDSQRSGTSRDVRSMTQPYQAIPKSAKPDSAAIQPTPQRGTIKSPSLTSAAAWPPESVEACSKAPADWRKPIPSNNGQKLDPPTPLLELEGKGYHDHSTPPITPLPLDDVDATTEVSWASPVSPSGSTTFPNPAVVTLTSELKKITPIDTHALGRGGSLSSAKATDLYAAFRDRPNAVVTAPSKLLLRDSSDPGLSNARASDGEMSQNQEEPATSPDDNPFARPGSSLVDADVTSTALPTWKERVRDVYS